MRYHQVSSLSNETKLLLLAIDGLSFPLLQKWVDLGDLPFFKKLMESGCYGLLNPFTPSNSAVIWTSVITGMNPKKHGIDSFIYYKVGERIIRKTKVKKILKFGARPLFRLLRRRRYVRDIPFSLDMVQPKMLWEIFAQEDRSVGVINWWYSWPVYEVPGFIISDRVHYWRLSERSKHAIMPDTHLVYPEWLSNEVVKRVVDPFSLSIDVYKQFMKVDESEIERMKDCHYSRHQLMSEFKYLYSMDESVRRLALFCLEEFPQPDFFALYFRGVDIISHCALKYAPFNRDSQITDKEVEQFGETVHQYYHYLDRVLKELIETISVDTTVMLVSDHGFEREPDGRFGHRKTKPPGFFSLSGHNIKTGFKIENASLYDIAPTLLYLSGLPVSKEMDGVVLTECVEEGFLQSYPIRFIENYGAPLRHKEPFASGSEEEIKERLRALGYID
jgi:predicted AlkP superfamily phosphohydrolase/phosphomutase